MSVRSGILMSAKDRLRRANMQAYLESQGFDVDVPPTETRYTFILSINGVVKALALYKFRETRYDTYDVDRSKIDDILEAANSGGAHALVFVEWKKRGVHMWRAHDGVEEGVMQRRKRRSHGGDVYEGADPSYKIPVEEFMEVSKENINE